MAVVHDVVPPEMSTDTPRQMRRIPDIQVEAVTSMEYVIEFQVKPTIPLDDTVAMARWCEAWAAWFIVAEEACMQL